MVKLTLKKIQELENKIKYWSKHQELDKHNISNDLSRYLYHMSFVIAIFVGIVGVITIILAIGPSISLFEVVIISILIIIGIPLMYWGYSKRKKWNSIIREHDNHFIVREAMIRVWYKSLDVDAGEIDDQFETITKKIYPRLSNKGLQDIAEKTMEDSDLTKE